MEIELRNYAHLGDAVWEVFVREHSIDKAVNIKQLHKMTTACVNAGFQHELLNYLEPMLTDKEKELVRRGRNLPIPVSRRNIQTDYRMATAFEILIGYWYINEKARLEEIKEVLYPKTFFYAESICLK